MRSGLDLTFLALFLDHDGWTSAKLLPQRPVIARTRLDSKSEKFSVIELKQSICFFFLLLMIFEPTSSCSSLVGFESVLVGDEGSDRGAGGCS